MRCDNRQLKDSATSTSIVVVNYNGGDAVLECLDSVIANTEPDAEVIVVDNASVDGSGEAIRARFPKIVVVDAGSNIGFGAGNNLGVNHATGKYIVFLNPDTLVCKGWAAALVAELERDDGVGLVTSKILMAGDASIINTCGNDVHLTGLTLCRGLGAACESFIRKEDVSAVSGAAFAMRRDLFVELGGFDEDMFLYVEDTDLSLRARLAGWKSRYTPESKVLHRYALKITPMKVFYQERNRYMMLLKTLRWPTLVVLSPAALLGELIAWTFVALKDRPNAGNKLRAWSWIWSNRRSILAKRKQVQSRRKVRDRVLLRSMGTRLDFGQAASPALAAAAHIVFDPLFGLIKLLALAIVWW
jgi:GT2 family glycosyltransferase